MVNLSESGREIVTVIHRQKNSDGNIYGIFTFGIKFMRINFFSVYILPSKSREAWLENNFRRIHLSASLYLGMPGQFI